MHRRTAAATKQAATSRAGSQLTIVMYHYVRPLENSRYPGIKGLSVAGFRNQLAHIIERYYPVTVEEVVHSVRTGDRLPPRAILLTFDDGYADHYEHVFPLLHDGGVPGAFFPPVDPIRNATLLDVNRIHFLLAACADRYALVRDIDAKVRLWKGRFHLKEPSEYWATWGRRSRFDDAETIYIKRMLQVALPPELRSELAAQLFKAHVTEDERSFARELYMDVPQLATMQRSGMYVGSHGRSHTWLDSLRREEQAEELDSSLAFLREIGSPVDDFWLMCYPYGAWNHTLIEELRARNCTLGLTAACRIADLDVDQPLLLPRLDTHDLPIE